MNKEELLAFLDQKLKVSRRTLAASVQGKRMKLILEAHTQFLDPNTRPIVRSWHLIHDTNERPLCKNCHISFTKFNSNKWGYLDFCSVKCQRNSDQVKENLRISVQKKYGEGITNPYQSEIVKDKIRQKMIERYGVDHNFKMAEKIRESINKKYGVDHYSQTEEFKEKYRSTMLEKHGVSHFSKTAEFRVKFKETCLERLGTEHPMKHPEILEKTLRKIHTFKNFELPSGKVIKLQGYEPDAIRILLQSLEEEDIFVGKKKIRDAIGSIEYVDFSGNKRTYFPDFYIKSRNKIVEVKSSWTFDRCGKISPEKNINILKMNACISRGFDFEFMIL